VSAYIFLLGMLIEISTVSSAERFLAHPFPRSLVARLTGSEWNASCHRAADDAEPEGQATRVKIGKGIF